MLYEVITVGERVREVPPRHADELGYAVAEGGVRAAIGPAFAHRIHDELHVDSLEELELAAHDGRLETVVGIGPRRAEAIRAALAYRNNFV